MQIQGVLILFLNFWLHILSFETEEKLDRLFIHALTNPQFPPSGEIPTSEHYTKGLVLLCNQTRL